MSLRGRIVRVDHEKNGARGLPPPGDVTVTTGPASGPRQEPAPTDSGAKNRWTIFAVVSIALAMASIDITIVSTSLSRIQSELHTHLNWATWTLTGYQLGALTAAPVFGKLSTIYGRKRVFLSCVVVFTVASLSCGLAQNIYMLIALRAIQGIGGGAFMPSATGIVSDVFGRDRDRAIGLFTSILPIGSLIGPVLGGVITADWSWRGIFFINVPIGVLLLTLGLRHLPKSQPRVGERPDFVGVALLAATLVFSMYGVTTLGNKGVSWTSPSFLVLLLVGLAIGVIFVRRMRRISNPIIPVHLLRHRTFAVMNVIALIYGGCTIGFGALVPIYAQRRYGIAILQSGTLLIARGVGSIAVAGATAFLLRRIGYRIPMLVGFGGAVLGLLMLAAAPHFLSTYAWLAIGALLMGLGMGISAPATNNATLSFSPGEVSQISGLRGMFRQCGGIMAINITSAFVNRSAVEGLALAHGFVVFAGVLVFIAIPLVFVVPSRRGTW